MDFLNNLEDNSILVVPNKIKNKILEYIDQNNLLLNIKFLTFRELKHGLFYSYTNEAIYEIMKLKNVNLGVAKEYIENTYYLLDDNYDNHKLKDLVNIKNHLDSLNYLEKDKLFIELLKSKNKMYVYGFSQINKYNKYLLDLASNYIKIEYIDTKINNYSHDVYCLKHIEDEVAFIAEKIANLIHDGILLDKIKIANYSNEYYFVIKKIFSLYGIPVYLKNDTKLSDTAIGKYFIDHLNNNIEYLLYQIKMKFSIDNNQDNAKVFNKLSNLINSYYWTTSYLDIKDLIKEEMKTISIPGNHYEHEIVTTDILDNTFDDDEYVFLIGFNQGSIPRTYKDEDYINDSIKTSIMDTSLEKNINNKKAIINAIKNIKNLTITCKEVSLSSNYLISPLIEEDFLTKIETDISYSEYSNKFNKLLYAMKIDDLIKFNEKDELLEVLHNNYDIDYKTYNNKYNLVDIKKVRELLQKKSFSYSNISTYYKCPFRFYLTNFFKLDQFEVTIDTFIGSLFHKVLEECINDTTKDIDKTYDKFIQEHKDELVFDDKVKFYVEKLRKEVHFIVDNIRKQYEYSNRDEIEEWHEKYIEFNTDDLDLKTNISVIIKGIVDKCLVIKNDIVIIDYKTGTSDHIDRDLFEYGITIQLPIYLYLLKNINKEYTIVGMYLQHILEGLIEKKDTRDKTVDEVRFNRLRLDGLTLDDLNKIKNFDESASSSEIIKSLKMNNKGEWSYPKRIMTKEDQEQIYNNIKRLIEDCINNVSDAKFDIKPISIKNKIEGCNYCKYRDICYKRESDTNIIQLTSEEGDINE